MGSIAGRKTQVNPDGTQVDTYVDIDTGQPIADPTNYFVYDYATLIAMGIIEQKPSSSGTPIETVNKEAYVQLENRNSMWAQMIENQYDLKSSNVPRSPEDNYGYKSQPKALGFAKFLPGLIGTVGKGVALVGNVNNTAATSSARETLNLKPQSGFSTIKSLVSDQRGKVADVQYKGSTIPVGLDVLDKSGRTQMTPDEARRRQAIDPTFRESTKEESKAAVEEFQTTYGQKGLLGKALTAIGSPLANLLPSKKGLVADFEESHAKAEKQITKEQKSMPTFDQVSKSPTAQSVSMDEAKSGGQGIAQSLDGSISYDQDAIPKMPNGLTPYDPRMNSLVNTNFSNIRTKPLNDLTTDQLNYAAYKLTQDLGGDVTVEVGSGGQKPEEVLRAEGISKGLTGKNLKNYISSQRTGSVRHNDGGAADVSLYVNGEKISFNDEYGKSAFSNFAKYAVAAGATGVGAGIDYMGDSTIHIGQGKPAIWGGASWLKKSYDEGLKMRGSEDYLSWAQQNASFVPPKPEVKPVSIPSVNPADMYSGTKDRRLIEPKVQVSNTSNNIFSSIDENTKKLMARTLAGEQLSDNTDESNAILSTFVQREGKYGSIEKAIKAPKQYSTWNNPKGINNMNTRYEQNPEKWDGLVSNFLSDPSNLKEYTSYHADYVKPSWSKKLMNSVQIGDHKFMELPEYKAPTKSTSSEVKGLTSSVISKTIESQKGFTSPLTSSQSTTGLGKSVPVSTSTKSNSGSYGTNNSFSKPTPSISKPVESKTGSYGTSSSSTKYTSSGFSNTPVSTNTKSTSSTSTPKSKTTFGPR